MTHVEDQQFIDNDLQAEVHTNKARASFKNGVLEVRIPKTEAAKKRGHKIRIE